MNRENLHEELHDASETVAFVNRLHEEVVDIIGKLKDVSESLDIVHSEDIAEEEDYSEASALAAIIAEDLGDARRMLEKTKRRLGNLAYHVREDDEDDE